MPTYEASTSIHASPEAAWRVLCNVAAWPEWLRTVDSVRALGSAVPALGARYRVRQPRLRRATWVVTEFDPPRRFVWEARSPGLQMIAEHTIVRVSADACRIALRFSFSGFLGGVAGRLYGFITASYLAQEAVSLKRKAEAQGSGLRVAAATPRAYHAVEHHAA